MTSIDNGGGGVRGGNWERQSEGGVGEERDSGTAGRRGVDLATVSWREVFCDKSRLLLSGDEDGDDGE